MKHFTNIRDAYAFCDAVGSPVRLEILEQILQHQQINLDTLAKNLHLTNGALTAHISKLESVGLIRVCVLPAAHGRQKQCSVALDRILIDVTGDLTADFLHKFTIPVGAYSACSVRPYCALLSAQGYIGERDDPRYFSYPQHDTAGLLWFKSGKISYMLPKPPLGRRTVREIRVYFEMSAKAAGPNADCEHEVFFALGGTAIGSHFFRGEFCDRRGALNPLWYDDALPQYGQQKMLSVTAAGSFLDGLKLSDVTVDALGLPDSLTFATESGLALFGKSFGDYTDDIKYVVITD